MEQKNKNRGNRNFGLRHRSPQQKNFDEGGYILYVSPGVRFAGGEDRNGALSFGVPIVTDLNGHQVEPDYRITSRINVTF